MPAPQMVSLAAPRPLTPEERLLAETVADLHGAPQLADQIGAAQVVSECDCGCPTVGLHTSAPPVAPDVIRDLTSGGRDDGVSLTTEGRTRDGRAVDVVLHIRERLVYELEVWAGTWGGDPRTELPAPTTLHPY